MRRLFAIAALVLTACVGEGPPLNYAHRAYPECLNHHVVAHRIDEVSLTEIAMTCDGIERAITVKCVHGWGILADTTCYTNN